MIVATNLRISGWYFTLMIRLGAVIGFSPMFGIYVSTNDGGTDHRPVEPSVKFML